MVITLVNSSILDMYEVVKSLVIFEIKKVDVFVMFVKETDQHNHNKRAIGNRQYRNTTMSRANLPFV